MGSRFSKRNSTCLIMQPEIASPSSSKKKFLFFILLTIVAYVLMRLITQNLSAKTIIEFEMAKTSGNAELMMSGWGPEGTSRFLKGIYTDFLFIIGYTGLFFYGCRYMGFFSGHYIFRKAGRLFSFLAPIAGVCDLIENFGMLFTIKQRVVEWVVEFTYDMARVKFSLLIIMVFFIIICLFYRAIDVLARDKRPIF